MSLTLQEVEHIARLARLTLSEEEKARYREQLSAILDYAARLQTLDTAQVSLADPATGQTSLREDEPLTGLDLAALLANAPRTTDEQFRVPPVLE